MNGRDGLIAHLRSTGTGEEKLAIGAKADLSGISGRLDEMRATIRHMKDSGVNPITLGKAQKYVDGEAAKVPPPALIVNAPKPPTPPASPVRPNQPPKPNRPLSPAKVVPATARVTDVTSLDQKPTILVDAPVKPPMVLVDDAGIVIKEPGSPIR